MLKTILHSIASHPRVYDLIQRAAGAQEVHRRLQEKSAALQAENAIHLVMDVGGGTGIYRDLWRSDCDYLCLDYDAQKLEGFVAKHPHDLALQGDATRIPMGDESLDAVLCSAVTHHLTDEMLQQAMAEMMRVLKPTGKLLFLDAVWNPRRKINRWMWKYDRGSSPHTAKRLGTVIAENGHVLHWESFSIYHQYVLCVAQPKAPDSALV